MSNIVSGFGSPIEDYGVNLYIDLFTGKIYDYVSNTWVINPNTFLRLIATAENTQENLPISPEKSKMENVLISSERKLYSYNGSEWVETIFLAQGWGPPVRSVLSGSVYMDALTGNIYEYTTSWTLTQENTEPSCQIFFQELESVFKNLFTRS